MKNKITDEQIIKATQEVLKEQFFINENHKIFAALDDIKHTAHYHTKVSSVDKDKVRDDLKDAKSMISKIKSMVRQELEEKDAIIEKQAKEITRLKKKLEDGKE